MSHYPPATPEDFAAIEAAMCAIVQECRVALDPMCNALGSATVAGEHLERIVDAAQATLRACMKPALEAGMIVSPAYGKGAV